MLNPRWGRLDATMYAIIGAAVFVALVLVAMVLTRGAEFEAVVLPWFLPTMNGLQLLVAACVAFLAFGRYRFLCDPASFWVGIGFSGFAAGLLFNVLTLPGMLPDGGSLLGDRSTTATWALTIALQILSISLLAAAVLRWPGEHGFRKVGWFWVVAGWIAFVLLMYVVLVAQEQRWPELASPDGSFRPLFKVINCVALGIEGLLGAALLTRQYWRQRDPLFGHAAICQLTLFGIAVLSAMLVMRYDPWWFVQRGLSTAGFLVVLFGLLAGYVQLYRIEQEKTQQSRISEARYRSLIQASAQAVWVADASGELTDDANSWRQFTGQTLEQMRGWGWLDAVHPDDRDRTTRIWRQAVATRGHYVTEYRLRNAAGEYRQMSVHGVPVLNGDGSVREWIGMNTDITEQRNAEAMLLKSEKKFRDVFEQSAIGMGRVNFGDARWEDANDAFCQMLGYTREEMRQIPWPQMTHPEDLELDMTPFRRMAAGELDSYSVEKRFLHRDGHHVWARMTLSLVRDAHEMPDYEIAIIEDITERKRAESALRESEERFRLVLENMSEGLMLFDAAGNLTYQNPASLRIHGFKGQEGAQIGRESLPVTWKAWDERGREIGFDEWPVSRVFRHERFQDQVMRVRRVETGKEFYGSYNGAPIYGTDGRIALGFITIRDITQQIRVQAELGSREARLRTIFESDMVGMMYWRADGTITEGNRKFVEMLGYSQEEMAAGKVRWEQITPQEYRDADERGAEEIRKTGVETPYEKEFIHKNGTKVPVIVGAAAFDESRREGVAFVLDITERKRVEGELEAAHVSAQRAKESAEQATRAKDQFLAVLSHELRTPLAPVLVGVGMLQDATLDEEATRETLEMIRRNVDMEARLIDDLLDVTRIVRGKIELHRRPVYLREVIEQAIEVCRQDIEAKHLHFRADIGRCGENLVDADPARLQQVFWNLLKNAVKFTPQGGCVGIRCHNDNGFIISEIVDSGEGIEPNLLPDIFNAFEQGGARVTRQFGGLGLGLTITRGVVELHGGSIEAYSEGKGRGATFRVALPVWRNADGKPVAHLSPAGEQQKPMDEEPRGLRVLVVEDHGDTARVMRRVLTARGHQVETAADVAEALALIEAKRFDLMLSDLGLPDGSGVDLMRTVRQQGRSLPGIALSGYGQEEDVRRSKEAGFAAHLTKPTNPDVLMRTIGTVARKNPGH